MAITIDQDALKKAVAAATNDLSRNKSLQYIFDRYDRQLAKQILVTDATARREFSRLIRQSSQIIANMRASASGPLIVDPSSQKDLEKALTTFSRGIRNTIDESTKAAWDLSDSKNEMIFRSLIRDSPLSTIKNHGLLARNIEAMAAFQTRKMGGFTISDRVWNLQNDTRTIIDFYTESGISAGRSANKIAGDLLGLLDDPGKIINVEGKAFSVVPDKDYKPGRGRYRSPFKNARRLAATETNIAYRTADHERWKRSEIVLGYEVLLSNNHTLNGVPFVDICDELVGRYPKTFKFTGWHPLCYDQITEVYTESGWKLFKDVQIGERCLSLNKDTFNLEYSPVVATIAYNYTGEMIRFYSDLVDMLVTPNHPMVYLDYFMRNFQEKPAEKFKFGLLLVSEDGLMATSYFIKESVSYSGMVYDVEIEHNHTLYTRRNGKTVWGSNCRCKAVPILPSNEDTVDFATGELEKLDMVEKMPENFTGWVDANTEKMQNWKSQPYFIQDNFTAGRIDEGLKKGIG